MQVHRCGILYERFGLFTVLMVAAFFLFVDAIQVLYFVRHCPPSNEPVVRLPNYFYALKNTKSGTFAWSTVFPLGLQLSFFLVFIPDYLEKVRISLATCAFYYDLHGPVYLYQLIELAGGLSENADEIHIDRVYLIEHAQSIYIPSLSDIDSEPTVHEFYTPTSATEDSSGKKGDKVDINSASADELASLPGIGKKTAQKIVEYRELNGRFESIEDIMKVSGIGESKFATIKDCIFTG